MAFVVSNVATDEAGATTVDVTLDTGTGSDRKAVIFTVAQDGEIQTMAVGRDPTGTDEAATEIRAETVFNSGDAYYHMTAFYLDLSVTGSQTFRVTYNGSPEKLGIAVAVYDDLASGAPEAQEAFESTSAGTTVTDDITTLTADAQVVGAAMMRTGTNETADPWFSEDDGQTSREDNIIGARLEWTVADLAVAVAAATTVGWTGTSSAQFQSQILLSFEEAGGGGGGIGIPIAHHIYAQQRGRS